MVIRIKDRSNPRNDLTIPTINLSGVEADVDAFIAQYPNSKIFSLDVSKLESADEIEHLMFDPPMWIRRLEVTIQIRAADDKLSSRDFDIELCNSTNKITVAESSNWADNHNKHQRVFTFECTVGTLRPVYTKEVVTKFRCTECHAETRVENYKDKGELPGPCLCRGGTWDKAGVRTRRWMRATVTELPWNVPDGELAANVEIDLFGDILQKLQPGMRLRVTGWSKEIKKRDADLSSKTYIHASSAVDMSPSRDSENLTMDDVMQIVNMSKKHDIFDILKRNVAPTIIGYDNIKSALLLQLFGGVVWEVPGNRVRGDIHMLMVGDRSTAKTQILDAIGHLSPLNRHVNGEGATAVGMVAAVSARKDGDWDISAGAAALANGGFLLIDEMDKIVIDKGDVMLNMMESQQVSIDKATVHVTVPTRVSVLAAANPVKTSFEKGKALQKQVGLTDTLMSRFDLIFYLLDERDKSQDDTISEGYMDVRMGEEQEVIDVVTFRKYVTYARKTIFPKIPAHLKEKIKRYYVDDLRTLKDSDGNYANVSLRTLNTCIRLMEASARIRLSNEVNEDDFALMQKLVDASYRAHNQAKPREIEVSEQPKIAKEIEQLVNNAGGNMEREMLAVKIQKMYVCSIEDARYMIEVTYKAGLIKPSTGGWSTKGTLMSFGTTTQSAIPKNEEVVSNPT